MNQDYHYSATFLASRRAGFSEEDSNKIAWAALMVDEMTKEQYKKMDFQDYKAEIGNLLLRLLGRCVIIV